ncbi:MAG: hypothetical protein AAGL69_03205 [Pseudomonadota bacterium]
MLAKIATVFDVLVVRAYLFVTDGVTQSDYDAGYPDHGTVTCLGNSLLAHGGVALLLWVVWVLPVPKSSGETSSIFEGPGFWLMAAGCFIPYYLIERAIEARGELEGILSRVSGNDVDSLRDRYSNLTSFWILFGFPLIGGMALFIGIVRTANGV